MKTTFLPLLTAWMLLMMHAALASDGTRQWSRMWGSPDDDEPHGAAVDTGGFVYVAGKTCGAFDGQTNQNPGWFDIFLSKFSPAGEKQ